MLAFFKRPNIADLPVFAIRGNHDSYFDWTEELQLTMTQCQWELPSFYYTKLVPSGSNGEIMGMLFIDSVLMLCSDYTSAQLEKTPLHDEELIRLRQIACGDPTWVTWGNTQYSWIIKTMEEWDQNPNIIWKVAVQHYPMFPLHYSVTDYMQIVNYFLPIL